MNPVESRNPSPFEGARRKSIVLSQSNLVESKPYCAGGLPLIAQPSIEEVDLVEWARGNRDVLDSELRRYGGILFRNFRVKEPSEFQELIKALCGGLLEYKERSSPRTQVTGNIYTSTDYPPDQSIFLHNENSYQHTFPLKIFFYCQVPATEGGETPIADVRKVYARIEPGIREAFREKGVMYVRNFDEGMGLRWQTVFQTERKDEVEDYCERAGIDVEWRGNNRLRIRQIRPAIACHPVTGETVWFNHATFFHITTLPPSVRDQLRANFKEEDLPNNTYYGDGTPIEPETMDHLREAYQEATVKFQWQRDDILMLDNMLVAHAREPFSGARRVLVGMAEPFSLDPE